MRQKNGNGASTKKTLATMKKHTHHLDAALGLLTNSVDGLTEFLAKKKVHGSKGPLAKVALAMKRAVNWSNRLNKHIDKEATATA